jgi:hypothetical protein
MSVPHIAAMVAERRGDDVASMRTASLPRCESDTVVPLTRIPAVGATGVAEATATMAALATARAGGDA